MDMNESKQLNDFQVRNIQLLAYLLKRDMFDYRIVEMLRESELEYNTLSDKFARLQSRVDIDEKTNLFKFKPDYLTNIIKMVSRVYDSKTRFAFSISLVRFDIDDFSGINTRLGHEAADRVLLGIAEILRGSSRPTDHVIRFGGDEFDVLLNSTAMEGAENFCQKIFLKMGEARFGVEDKGVTVTLSSGISTLQYFLGGSKIIDDAEIRKLYEDLRSRADDALYEAKSLGKNRYCRFTEEKALEYARLRQEYSR